MESLDLSVSDPCVIV